MLALAPAGKALAVELADGKLSLNGFGQWAYGNSSNKNVYEAATPGGDFGSGSFALALHAQMLDRGTIAAQGRLNRDDGTANLDWAFAEWRFSDAIHFRVGIVQHPFGISGDVRDVGTLRPFFLLPSGVYGTSGITGEAVDGGAISGAILDEASWSLRYDAYFGSLHLPSTDPYDKLETGFRPGGTLVPVEDELDYVAGGRLIAATPVAGLSFRLSGYATLRDTRAAVMGLSVQYATDQLDLRAEYFLKSERGQETGALAYEHAGYVEGSLYLTSQVQAGLRAELYRAHLLGYGGPRPLLDHRELAATLNYWFAPGFVLKLSGHLIDGNRFAHPVAVDDAILAGTLERRTLAVIFGTQFSF
jgi:hypothetical protein